MDAPSAESSLITDTIERHSGARFCLLFPSASLYMPRLKLLQHVAIYLTNKQSEFHGASVYNSAKAILPQKVDKIDAVRAYNVLA